MARFLVTGGAGFIGSSISRTLVEQGHSVRIIDDFSTGRRENLEGIEDRIELIEGSICDEDVLAKGFKDVDYCLHQAAIASVPRSIHEPVECNRANIEGTLKIFLAARDCGAKRVVFASSSAVYGNASGVPADEGQPLKPISPYGVMKATNELYARVCADLYDIEIVGLRYFNVFGPRQDPASQYAAVVPLFVTAMLAGKRPTVHGDGRQSRDFSYVENVVAANVRACLAEGPVTGVYNVACGQSTAILDLVGMLNSILGTDIEPDFGPARAGDIRQSWANIEKARGVLGYEPLVSVEEGLEKTVEWYRNQGR